MRVLVLGRRVELLFLGWKPNVLTDRRTEYNLHLLYHTFYMLYIVIFGAASRNRTHIRRVEAYCIIHYTIAAFIGASRETWTLNPLRATDFKSVVYTIPPYSHKLLEHRTGFEPVILLFCRQLRWASPPSVHILVREVGIEPTPRRSKPRRLPLSYSLINLVDRKRIELLPLTCKASVLPLSLTAQYWWWI